MCLFRIVKILWSQTSSHSLASHTTPDVRLYPLLHHIWCPKHKLRWSILSGNWPNIYPTADRVTTAPDTSGSFFGWLCFNDHIECPHCETLLCQIIKYLLLPLLYRRPFRATISLRKASFSSCKSLSRVQELVLQLSSQAWNATVDEVHALLMRRWRFSWPITDPTPGL